MEMGEDGTGSNNWANDFFSPIMAWAFIQIANRHSRTKCISIQLVPKVPNISPIETEDYYKLIIL